MTSRLILVLFLMTIQLHADSVILKSAEEMIESSDYVAVVEFQKAERGVFKRPAAYLTEEKRSSKQFPRRVSVRVIENLKGSLPEQIQIYDESGFWDALFQNHHDLSKSSGRYLIFLRGGENFLTGTNGWASTSRIDGDQIEWTDAPNAPEFRMVSLVSVLDRVKKQLQQK